MLRITVHHTCKKDGGSSAVEKEAPFFSEYNEKKNKRPFLGSGYYFWEYNKEYAKVWGKQHYGGKYFICEGIIEIDQSADGYYLDLAGNRQQMVKFVNLLRKFELFDGKGLIGVNLSDCIELLRDELGNDFSWQVIRAIDYQNHEQKGLKIRFNENTGSFMYLNPRVILSYKEKNQIRYCKPLFVNFASVN